jgi:hypothetical protein
MNRLGRDQKLAIELALLCEGVELKPGEVFVVVDGDRIGNSAATPLLRNEIDEAIRVSKIIHKGQNFIEHWTRQHHGQVLIDGGDNSVLKIGRTARLEKLREGYAKTTGFTLSIGVGLTTETADKALVVAKWRGRDRVVIYDNQVEQDFIKASLEANDAVKLQSQIGENQEPGQNEEPADPHETVEGFELSPLDVHNMKMLQRGETLSDHDLSWLKECELAETDAAGKPTLTQLGREIIGV